MQELGIGAFVAVAGFILVFCGYKLCEVDHVDLAELERHGYKVIRHSETHGQSYTNWVEVVRKDGRPL